MASLGKQKREVGTLALAPCLTPMAAPRVPCPRLQSPAWCFWLGLGGRAAGRTAWSRHRSPHPEERRSRRTALIMKSSRTSWVHLIHAASPRTTLLPFRGEGGARTRGRGERPGGMGLLRTLVRRGLNVKEAQETDHKSWIGGIVDCYHGFVDIPWWS